MEFSGFSSLFEIFTASYIAYAIVDQVSGHGFMQIVIVRILRRYESSEKSLKELEERIDHIDVSLRALSKLTQWKHIQNAILVAKQNMLDARDSLKFTKDAISKKIQEHCNQEEFGIVSLYLALYSIYMLIICGIPGCEEEIWFVNTLAVQILLSWIFVSISWSSRAEDRYNELAALRKKKAKMNGRFVATCVFPIIIALGFIIPTFIYIEITPSHYHYYYNLIVSAAILLPLFNFIVHFIKACRKKLSMNEQKNIDALIKKCHIEAKENINKANKFIDQQQSDSNKVIFLDQH